MGKVVIAEDDKGLHPFLVRFVSEVVEPLGHTVVSFWDGDEARKEIIANSGLVVLLITDIYMPKLDGYGLIRSVAKEVDRVIIQSTVSADSEVISDLVNSLETVIIRVCPKPWDINQLQSSILDILHA